MSFGPEPGQRAAASSFMSGNQPDRLAMILGPQGTKRRFGVTDAPMAPVALPTHQTPGTEAWRSPVDHMIRSEISDAAAQRGPGFGQQGKHRLSDVLKHPELFEIYPELGEVMVDFGVPDYGGAYYDPNTNSIGVGQGSKTPGVSLMHETQHAVQEIEGTTRGANYGGIMDAMKEVQPHVSEFDLQVPAYMFYQGNLGEQEAWLTGHRSPFNTGGREFQRSPYVHGTGTDDINLEKELREFIKWKRGRMRTRNAPMAPLSPGSNRPMSDDEKMKARYDESIVRVLTGKALPTDKWVLLLARDLLLEQLPPKLRSRVTSFAMVGF